MVKTKYSQNAWKQFLERLHEKTNETLETETSETGSVIVKKSTVHTRLVMEALAETARNKGYMSLLLFISSGCEY